MEPQLKCFEATFEEGYSVLVKSFNDWISTYKPAVTGVNWFAIEPSKKLFLIAAYTTGRPPQIVPIVMPPGGGNIGRRN